jgi:PIN domain nuclease of toxin-antitoxin system
VRLLLDTHALLWALSAPARLPASTARAIRDPSNAVYVSAASTWEIAIKAALGKVSADVDEVVRTAAAVGFAELPISNKHAQRVRSLPAHHRDPFDRMLIAQAMVEGLMVVTHDREFSAYKVSIEWS